MRLFLGSKNISWFHATHSAVLTAMVAIAAMALQARKKLTYTD